MTPRCPTTTNLVLHDLYTYGSPRVALGDFVSAFSSALALPLSTRTSSEKQKGNGRGAWRICSSGDPVPLVPPVLLTDPAFIHLDVGFRVSEDSLPERLPSESGTHPRPPLPVFNMSNHSEWWLCA